MNYIVDIFTNPVLMIPAISWLVAQLAKLILTLVIEKRFDAGRLFGDGGMPSCHTATVISLAMMCGVKAGFDSVVFALSLIFAIVVMRDAMGVRLEAGKQAKSIKEIAEAVNKTFLGEDVEIRTENLKVLVGHTPLQVFFGAVTGIAVTLLALWIIS